MSALTLQQALRAAHFDLMEQDSRVFVMGEDVGVLGFRHHCRAAAAVRA